jgi:cytochrome c556
VCAGLACAEAPQYHPLASSKQLMAAVSKPAMDSLAAMNKAGGPKDDEQWKVAEQNAAVLGEAAQLLLMGNRPLDQDIWLKTSAKLQTAAASSLKAAQEKNLEAWKASVGQIGSSCRGCHNVHKKKPASN